MNQIALNIYNQLLQGSPNNPGIPEALAELVTAQSQHETGNYTSNVFNTANNAFGYNYSGGQYQTGIFEGFATYENYLDSANELIDYLYRRQNDGSFPDLRTITNPAQYAALLKGAGYYTDNQSTYQNGITNYLSEDGFPVSQNGNPGITTAGIIGAVAVVALLFFSFKAKKS